MMTRRRRSGSTERRGGFSLLELLLAMMLFVLLLTSVLLVIGVLAQSGSGVESRLERRGSQNSWVAVLLRRLRSDLCSARGVRLDGQTLVILGAQGPRPGDPKVTGRPVLVRYATTTAAGRRLLVRSDSPLDPAASDYGFSDFGASDPVRTNLIAVDVAAVEFVLGRGDERRASDPGAALRRSLGAARSTTDTSPALATIRDFVPVPRRLTVRVRPASASQEPELHVLTIR